MNSIDLRAAVAEAERFIARAQTLLAIRVTGFYTGPWKNDGAPVQQAAVRRASLDLTRALADLRRRDR